MTELAEFALDIACQETARALDARHGAPLAPHGRRADAAQAEGEAEEHARDHAHADAFAGSNSNLLSSGQNQAELDHR